MKTALTLALITQLSGCASDYVIATQEGQMLLTKGKPTLDKNTGMLSYTDENGNHHQINRNKISQIIER
ncbi:YgdI/YgdR family lipoprotein [Prodigiosinella confusarubida]|uniref:YgdI/YgdR family lipoprotein n=2 Tax=Enterobacterales TaxID=91347 RepID=A0A2I5TDK4_SERS3|nr:YgdI/YgdR family lipoprotein [Serratia sp. ATCC 39006]AUH06926.1 YgdI/YgdR family lipoprotein [Serratia sp. ATCC 39006]